MFEIFGYMAAVLTTVAFVPQVIKIYKDKSAKSISFRTFYIFTIGIVCWLIYGISLGSVPMIISNSVAISLNVMIIVMKHLYKGQ